MKILIDPELANDIEDVFIPPHLRKHIVSWARAHYKKFDAGHLLMQEFNAVGYSVYLYYFIIECPATIYAQYSKPTIAFLQQEKTIRLCYFPKGITEISFSVGIFERMYIEVEPDWIKDIAYNNESIRNIFQAPYAGIRDKICAEPVMIDYLINQRISGTRDCRETGADLQIELKVQILELLNLYRKALKEKETFKNICLTSHKETLLDIWKEIKSNPNIHLHNLSTLSRQKYMHQKTLSRNFKKIFRVDLQSYVLDQCMQKGFHLISTTTRKIQDISSELGYKETNSFNRAFKKYFSVSPQALRS